MSDNTDAKASLIGFGYDRSYLRRLTKTIDTERLGKKIEIILNAKREVVFDTLFRAKALVHLACLEPFGIAVVEGMAAECIPIVRKGPYGPWMEITGQGKYGLGFDTIEGLAVAIEKAIKDYQSFSMKEITSRALDFDEVTFQGSFLKLLTQFLEEN
jgi:glycosyltransferase involved in cell wall biosynthesis